MQIFHHDWLDRCFAQQYYVPCRLSYHLLQEAKKGICADAGGPFGAVIVKDGKIIGKGHNTVVQSNDPTSHGEISAIRDACNNLKSFNLKGTAIYTTGEPCPMCLGAILWANIDKIYYGCSIKENDMIGFRDEVFYKKLSLSTEKLKDNISQIEHEECLKLFKEYLNKNNKINY